MNTSSPAFLEVAVNGDKRSIPVDSTLADLVDRLALAGKRFAVERNGEIVPRAELALTPLRAGDQVEIVQAIGGG